MLKRYRMNNFIITTVTNYYNIGFKQHKCITLLFCTTEIQNTSLKSNSKVLVGLHSPGGLRRESMTLLCLPSGGCLLTLVCGLPLSPVLFKLLLLLFHVL